MRGAVELIHAALHLHRGHGVLLRNHHRPPKHLHWLLGIRGPCSWLLVLLHISLPLRFHRRRHALLQRPTILRVRARTLVFSELVDRLFRSRTSIAFSALLRAPRKFGETAPCTTDGITFFFNDKLV